MSTSDHFNTDFLMKAALEKGDYLLRFQLVICHVVLLL